MHFSSAEISEIVKGRLSGRPDLEVTNIVTDSRLSSLSRGDAFLAISGKNHDGHRFIRNLYARGIRTFIVQEPSVNTDEFPDSAFIFTDNTVSALQSLAARVRSTFSFPVIGVTGSAGKTVVKEWLADVLGLELPVLRSPRSYNSQIGVPLSVLKLDPKYRLAVFEAGISSPGEMDNLQKVMNPDVGIITNIGDAHRENFPDNSAKTREKLKLFRNVQTVIYCSDQVLIKKLISEDEALRNKRKVDWSFSNQDAVVYVRKKIISGNHTDAELIFEGKLYSFSIPFSDRASVENALTVVAAAFALGTNPAVIGKGLSGLVSVAMRMEKKSGINRCYLIEDYYNSDPGSLGMALEYLKSQKSEKTTLILSDFIESGRLEKELYSDVAELVRKTGIRKFIGIGPALSRCAAMFREGSRFFNSTADFVKQFEPADYKDEMILIKGARRFEFEDIGRLLELQVHQTLMEVNLDAIAHNLNEFRRILKPGTGIMVMVKAFAYGAGPSEIASFLEYNGIGYLGVAYADEGVELRNAGVKLPVMVMNPDPGSYDLMIRYNLEPEIFNLKALKKFSETASRYGLFQYPVHIKIDTGMHRLGFMPEETEALAEFIRSSEHIRIASVFSHFASSEDPEYDHFTHKQAAKFLTVAGEISKVTDYPFIRHICNSAASVRFPEYHFDMVRPGIGIYGAGEFPGLSLKPAGRFTSRISQVKKIPAGEPVGYNCADVSDTDRTIATIPAGYADGLNRKLGNRNGSLFIKGKRAPIIGNICMDMCMVDITGIDAAEDDEAEIFGENISIEEIAEKCGTIPYEILTSVPARVKRVFSRE